MYLLVSLFLYLSVSVLTHRELIASFNKITALPPEIGRLKRLRRLVLNNNKIRAIPNDIGQLENLEELILSENYIEDFPVSVSMMASLKVIKLSNNRLKSIPFEVADILTLEEIDCSNNPNLDSIPAKWRGDTDSVLFTCKVHRGTQPHCFILYHESSFVYASSVDFIYIFFLFRSSPRQNADYGVRMAEMMRSNVELSRHAQVTEQDNLVMKVCSCFLLHFHF